MKKILIIASILLFVGALFIANNRFGLLSMAGLNGKGLPAKVVKGNLANASGISFIKIDHSKWHSLLNKYVDEDGKVDYDGFINEKDELNNYLEYLSKQLPNNEWSVQEQLAYYINLYNAHTVNLIIQNYPVKSIKEIDGAWTTEFIKIGNKELSLGALEHSILRKMNEPRIHFAINCASGSCPKLLNKAYLPEKLNDQLEEATHGFINSVNNNIGKKELHLSRIFKWYKNDFLDGDLLQYIKPYTTVIIAPDAGIKYKEYDWSLNKKS